jgi:hypothetical protein
MVRRTPREEMERSSKVSNKTTYSTIRWSQWGLEGVAYEGLASGQEEGLVQSPSLRPLNYSINGRCNRESSKGKSLRQCLTLAGPAALYYF